MNKIELKAQQLTELSIIRNCIARGDYSADLAAELSLLSDDGTENDLGDRKVYEYWGTDDADNEWRVHLTQWADA